MLRARKVDTKKQANSRTISAQLFLMLVNLVRQRPACFQFDQLCHTGLDSAWIETKMGRDRKTATLVDARITDVWKSKIDSVSTAHRRASLYSIDDRLSVATVARLGTPKR